MTEPGQTPTPSAETPPAETPDAPEERTFTQADLNKIAANEKREGRTSVLAELGVEDLDSLKEIVTTYNEAQAEAQSDLEKLEAERDTLKEQVKAANKLADDRLIEAKLETALIGAGVPADRVADALRLADRSNLSVGENSTVAGLEDAVTATLEPRQWLTESGTTITRRAPDATSKEQPKFDPATMTDEQIDALAQASLNGQPMPVIQGP